MSHNPFPASQEVSSNFDTRVMAHMSIIGQTDSHFSFVVRLCCPAKLEHHPFAFGGGEGGSHARQPYGGGGGPKEGKGGLPSRARV